MEFYFVFFLALIILARVSGSGPVLGSTDLQLDSYSANFSAISNGNYNFNYQFVVDGVTSTYTGSHYEKMAYLQMVLSITIKIMNLL